MASHLFSMFARVGLEMAWARRVWVARTDERRAAAAVPVVRSMEVRIVSSVLPGSRRERGDSSIQGGARLKVMMLLQLTKAGVKSSRL